MRCSVLGLAILVLSACAAATPPAATETVVQTLRAQLQADAVVVQQISLTPGPPATLTVEYMLNEEKIAAQAEQSMEVTLPGESERSVHAITRRVVQQVAAGAPIERVILREHLGAAPAQGMLVMLADMQAWVNGTIDDNQYHARWCCTAP